MNIIKCGASITTVTTLGALVCGNETAFIGSVGGIYGTLFLISFDRIILATNPRRTWSEYTCPVTVDRFVDLEITVKERKS